MCYNVTGAVVARVRMNKLDASAYKCAFEAIFGQVKKRHPEFGVGKSLKGIITDWSDTQLKGLQSVIGEDKTSQVVKGCQVMNLLSMTNQYTICYTYCRYIINVL